MIAFGKQMFVCKFDGRTSPHDTVQALKQRRIEKWLLLLLLLYLNFLHLYLHVYLQLLLLDVRLHLLLLPLLTHTEIYVFPAFIDQNALFSKFLVCFFHGRILDDRKNCLFEEIESLQRLFPEY
ncbi:hypothetical protein F5879DRAFT_383383 [Lentinula edodes]|nr:hypothetical protein F5879DRAFT_383383 [Lentinula edodes]